MTHSQSFYPQPPKTAEQVAAEQRAITERLEVKALLAMPEFQRFCVRALRLTRFDEIPMHGNSKDIFINGMRNAGAAIVDILCDADADAAHDHVLRHVRARRVEITK